MPDEWILRWLRLDKGAILASKRANLALAEAQENASPPEKLRPATAADIQPGSIIWYPKAEPYYWMLVSEVRHPDDDFKAYIGHDGCRYGLHGAFVECDE